jgi:hypothetical protein
LHSEQKNHFVESGGTGPQLDGLGRSIARTFPRLITNSITALCPRRAATFWWAARSYTVTARGIPTGKRIRRAYRLNSNKGTKTLIGVFATFYARRTFGNSAAPKIGSCLVGQFWGLNTDRILQPFLRKVVLSQNGSPHGVHHWTRWNRRIRRLSRGSASNGRPTMPESRAVRLLVPLLEFNQGRASALPLVTRVLGLPLLEILP